MSDGLCPWCWQKRMEGSSLDRPIEDMQVEPLSVRKRWRKQRIPPEAVAHLREALLILTRAQGDCSRACWRVADVLHLLGERYPDAEGIAEPTGRGAMLAKLAKRR